MLPLCVAGIDLSQAAAYGETLFINRQIAHSLSGIAWNTPEMGVALREFIHRVGWGRQVRGNKKFRSLIAEAGATPGHARGLTTLRIFARRASARVLST
jgi:hypothetical protein